MPTPSWPSTVPAFIPPSVPRTMCRSVPQIALAVSRTMASAGSCNIGSSTSSRRMSPTSWNTTAFMFVLQRDLSRRCKVLDLIRVWPYDLEVPPPTRGAYEQIRDRRCDRRVLRPVARRRPRADERADVQQGRRANPVQELHVVSSAGRDRADVAPHVPGRAAMGQVDSRRGVDRHDAAVA